MLDASTHSKAIESLEPSHPFYVPEKGWTSAIELRAGDILVTSNGEYVVVEKVQHEILETPVIVYIFEVEGYHTYYVSVDAAQMCSCWCTTNVVLAKHSGLMLT